MLLYKYMPWKYWFDSVLMGQFKMTRPDAFNDPFDCINAVCGWLPDSVVEEAVDCLYTQDEDFQSRETFKKLFLQVYPGHVKDADYHRELLSSLCLILCFAGVDGLSEEADLLMWSHYADSAKGVRITFDIPEDGGAYALERVCYSKEIPVYDLSKGQHYCSRDDFVGVYRQWIITKGLAWKYENEVRLILHTPDMDAHRVVHNGVECFKMPQAWIKEVTFGSEVDANIASECVKCFEAVGIKTICWLKAYKKRFEYGLEYHPITTVLN